MRVSDVMTTRVISVAGATDVREVARIMLSNRISGVPVVDDAGQVVGMLSEGDLMRRAETGTLESPPSGQAPSAAARAEQFVKSHGLHARDVMTRPVISLAEDALLEEVASLFEHHHIKRAPVLRGGRLVGIVSRANLLQGLVARRRGDPVEDDRVIRAAILKALEETGIRRHSLSVNVARGTVYLWGIAQSVPEREAVRVAAESTPGVKAVENHLLVFGESTGAAPGI